MCGITGFFDPSKKYFTGADALAKRMADRIAHRGPDADGLWLDDAAGIALAHRRLSIIDLSAAGAQPMISPSGRFVMVFNGEIYNHNELRRELPNISWRGHSDTETLLAMIDAVGLKTTLQKTIGMFAIALWDREERTLHLTRDRVGEKPLYYGIHKGVLLFTSELKALKPHPAFEPKVDRGALAIFLQQKYIPAPHSIYEGMRKLMPGSFISFKMDLASETQYYWNPNTLIESALARPFGGSPQEAVDKLDQLMKQSVSRQMLADVPLGAFLSGGIDSSSVVGVMQSLSSRPMRTFTIGFHEKDFNEAEHAAAVARHLGTQHEEMYVTAKHALDLVPKLPTVYCEPFADKSQIPTMLLCAMTRKHVTVALSGDGGDELFAGYTRYFESLKWMKKVNRIPVGLRGTAAPVVRGLSIFDRKWRQYADLLAAPTESQFYQRRVTKWQGAEDVVLGAKLPPTIFSDESLQPRTNNLFHRMMAIDFLSYLPDDIMCKVDRAAMASSLETRIPLLSQDIIEFAWSLPVDLKTKGGIGKWPLRQVLDRYVPRHLIERPKSGFNVPIPQWLRGELKEWAEAQLSEKRLKEEGFFDVAAIRKQWREHLTGRHNRTESLWSVLMFQAWLEQSQKGGS